MEAAELIAIVRVPKDLAEGFPGCEFLLPTRMDERWVAGMKFVGRTVLAVGPTHWETYHELVRGAVRQIL